MSLQRLLDLSTNTHITAATSTTQGIHATLVSLPIKMGTHQSAQKMLGPLSSRPETLVMSPKPLWLLDPYQRLQSLWAFFHLRRLHQMCHTFLQV